MHVPAYYNTKGIHDTRMYVATNTISTTQSSFQLIKQKGLLSPKLVLIDVLADWLESDLSSEF